MFEVITKDLVTSILPQRKENSNKGDYGKVLNIVGSNKYIGAGMLTSLASLRVGAGYSIFCSCDDVIQNISNYSPDIVYKSHENFNPEIIKNIITNEHISAIVLGCGISTDENVISFTNELIEFLKETTIPCVIDADGLNCLSILNTIELNNNFILTPHPKELSRLLNVDVQEIQTKREYYATLAQEKTQAIVILKGHNTLIATDNSNLLQNVTGNSALAKAGTGDILSGMLGGFLAQKTSTKQASILSVYLHGLAAEIYSNEYSEYSLLASDLLNYIPIALKLCK